MSGHSCNFARMLHALLLALVCACTLQSVAAEPAWYEGPAPQVSTGQHRWQLDQSLRLSPRQKLDFELHAPWHLEPGSGEATDPNSSPYRPKGDNPAGEIGIYHVDYAFSLLKRSNWDLWGSLGLQLMNLDLSADASRYARFHDDRPRSSMPTLGLSGRYSFASKWDLQGGVKYFNGAPFDRRGQLLDAELAVEYKGFDRMGIGMKYDFVSIDAGGDAERLQEFYGLRFDRLGIYAKMPLD